MERSRIPNSLKKYRRLAGYSQKEVSRVLGLQQSSCISRWEKGFSLPGTEYLFRLSFLYKTVPNHLYQDVCKTWKDECLINEQKLIAHDEPIKTLLLENI
jgi:Predicted transcriptional regulator with C-terminal CBS domains